jgi:parallel beta-helix repeat protein
LPILCGSDSVTGWSDYSGPIYSAELATEPVNVYVDETASWGLTPAASTTSITAGSWYWSGNQLYVRLQDDSDPSNHLVEAAVRPFGVFAQNASYVTIDHLEVLRTGGWGIEFISSSNPSQTVEPVISNNVVSQNGTGTFDDGDYRNAIYINEAQSPTVEGNTVSYAGGHNGIQVQYATNVLILNNDVSHFNHTGLDTKFSDQVLYAGTVVHDSDHVSLYSQNSSNLTAEDNVIYNIGGSVCGGADGIHFDIGSSGQISVDNNSIYNTYCPIYLLAPAVVMNNAMNDSGGPALRAVSGGTFNYNDLGQNGWVEIDSNQYNFSQWRALGGHSGDKDVDPEWVSPGTGDMSLAPGSPCIDAGTNVGLPYAGSQPDMGAVDSQ